MRYHAAQLCFVLIALGTIALVTPAQESQSPNAQSPLGCITVMGAVKTPVRLAMQRRVRLTEVLTLAGGFTNSAGQTIQIISVGMKCTNDASNSSASQARTPRLRAYRVDDIHTNDEARNPYLEGGDLVIVPEGDCAYVMGAVVQPRQISLKNPMSVTGAIALAGGLLKDASTDKVSIYRQSTNSSGRLQVLVDLDQIRKKRAADPILQPNDIVEVPDRYGEASPKFWDPQRPIYDAPMVGPPVYRMTYGLRTGI